MELPKLQTNGEVILEDIDGRTGAVNEEGERREGRERKVERKVKERRQCPKCRNKKTRGNWFSLSRIFVS